MQAVLPERARARAATALRGAAVAALVCSVPGCFAGGGGGELDAVSVRRGRGGVVLGAPAGRLDGELVGPTDVGRIDVEQYRIDIHVDPVAETFHAYTVVRMQLLEPHRVYALDLAREVVVDRVAGTLSRHQHFGDRLYLSTEGTMRVGPAEVGIEYHGRLNDFVLVCEPDFGGLMVGGNRSGNTIVHSVNWPDRARRWIPTHDHPADGAAVELKVEVPHDLAVVANGTLVSVEERDDGRTRVWQWSETRPIPPHAIHFAAFDWMEHRLGEVAGVPVRAYLYDPDRQTADALSEAVPALAWAEERIGPFGWSKYAMLAAPLCGGAFDEATAVTLDESDLTDFAWARETAVRQLMRHWFGNAVRIATWNDAWWPDGLAGYLAILYLGEAWGPDAERAFLLRAWQGADRAPRRALRPRTAAEIAPAEVADDLGATAGIWLFRSVHHAIGDAAFWAAVRAIAQDANGEAIGTDQVRGAFEAASGQDLRWAFEELAESDRRPSLDARVLSWEAETGRATVAIEQRQASGPLELPVEIEVRGAGGAAVRATTWLAGETTEVNVPVAFAPERVVIDPDATLLVDVRCEADADCAAGRRCATLTCVPYYWD